MLTAPCAPLLSASISAGPDSDITRHQRTSVRASAYEADARARQREAILAFSRRTTSRSNVDAQLRDAASLIAEVLGCDLAAYVSEMDYRQFRLTARFISDVSRVRERTVSYSRRPSDTVVGLALEAGLPVACGNLESDDRFDDSTLVEMGVVAVLAVPLQLHREALGALVVMSSSERDFSPEDVLFVEVVAQLLSASIGRIQAESSLREVRGLLDTVVDSVDACVIVMDPDGRITRVNRCCERWSGFAPNEVVGRPMWSAFIEPEELQQVRSAFREAITTEKAESFESWLKHKSGKTRRIHWKSSVQRDGHGRVTSIIFTGNDLTHAPHPEDKSQELSVENERSQLAVGKLRRQVPHSGRKPVPAPKADASVAVSDRRPIGTVGGVGPFEVIPHEPVSHERRGSPRRAYPYIQKIAPMTGPALPTCNDLREVPFRDISAGGVSFLLWYEPDFQHVVVELGQGRKTIWVTAEVVWTREVGEGEDRAYLVGCKFLGRVNLSGD